VAGLWLLAASPMVDRGLARLIGWALQRWTRLAVRDYVSLLHLSVGYRVEELAVEEGDWLAGKSLSELKLTREGVLVLGVQREDGRHVGAPTRETTVGSGDLLLLYGRAATLGKLDERYLGIGGDLEHEASVAEQQKVVEEQEKGEADARKETENRGNR